MISTETPSPPTSRTTPPLPVTGDARPYPDGVRVAPVHIDGGRAHVVPGARSGSLRAAATADAVAIIDPDWTSGAPAELLTLP